MAEITELLVEEREFFGDSGTSHPSYLGGINLSGEDSDLTILLPIQSVGLPSLALDIGGSLIKLVYFSRHENELNNDDLEEKMKGLSTDNIKSHPVHVPGGSIHFLKFETKKIDECLDFIHAEQLHNSHERNSCDVKFEAERDRNATIKVTGGGAYKFDDMFKKRLGVTIEKEDEMECLIHGANFLFKVVQHEVFTHMEGQREVVQIHPNELFPYLLVNIGSGVSINKVDGDGKFELVDGFSVGGGACWGLGRLLTKCKSFDEFLELSKRGNNKAVDMLITDIFGVDYNEKMKVPPSAIISNFGKLISENIDPGDYMPEDISKSLLQMISSNIGQIACLNALLYGLTLIVFGGSFIKNNPYTLDTISSTVYFRSKGKMKAMFLRHEGFAGALGALIS